MSERLSRLLSYVPRLEVAASSCSTGCVAERALHRLSSTSPAACKKLRPCAALLSIGHGKHRSLAALAPPGSCLPPCSKAAPINHGPCSPDRLLEESARVVSSGAWRDGIWGWQQRAHLLQVCGRGLTAVDQGLTSALPYALNVLTPAGFLSSPPHMRIR